MPDAVPSSEIWCNLRRNKPQSCFAKLPLHTCISSSLYCSPPWVAEHVWVLTLNMFSSQQQNPRNPTARKMTAHTPAHTSVKFQLLLDLLAVCCQSACLGLEWFAVEKHEGHVHPPGCSETILASQCSQLTFFFFRFKCIVFNDNTF